MQEEFFGENWHKIETEKLIVILDVFSIESKKNQETKESQK